MSKIQSTFGYGEALLKAALMLDDGEVETVAHYYAAAFFDPKVSMKEPQPEEHASFN